MYNGREIKSSKVIGVQEKYFCIEPEKARELLSQTKGMKPAKRGIDRRAYLIGDYAVLSTSRLKLRNVATRDDDLAYLDELIETLMRLREQGVAVVPILGYCFDPDSRDGAGYIFQPRAKGEELYDDAVLVKYYVWAQKKRGKVYLSSKTNAKEYILSRTSFISKIPQEHFDKFISDMIVLADNDLLIDSTGKSNFFYDAAAGFQFIDIDSHTDYKYGLAAERIDGKEEAAYSGFAPCHLAAGTAAFAHIALDKKAISKLGDEALRQLAQDNRVIFEKCRTAMLHNGIPEEQLERSLAMLKFF